MSVNKLISIKNAIITAQDELGIDHDKDIPFFTNLATRAENKIGSYWQFERARAVIEIKDCIALLPNDSVKIELAILGDLGTECENLFNQTILGIPNNVTNVNSAGPFLVVDVSGSNEGGTMYGYVNYAIQNNKLIFDRSFCGNHITIQYLKYKTDCNGFLEVGQNHIDAIAWYIIWKYLFRKSQSNYLDRDKMLMAKQEWERECAHARALDNELTFSQRQEIKSLYHDAYSGIGLWQATSIPYNNNYTIW